MEDFETATFNITSISPIKISEFSNWHRLKRVTVYVLWFLKDKIWNKLSVKTKEKFPLIDQIFNKIKNAEYISAQEQRNAVHLLVRMEQLHHYPKMFDIIAKEKENRMKDQLQLFVEDGRLFYENNLLYAFKSISLCNLLLIFSDILLEFSKLLSLCYLL